MGLYHRESESSQDALRRAGSFGLVTWRYKNQGIIDAYPTDKIEVVKTKLERKSRTPRS